jgi:hypothetical protein
MKRIDIIERLVAKGFSTNTLVKFNDNQLHKLSTKLLGEGLQVKADDLKNDPTLADKLKDLKDKDVTIVPEEMGALKQTPQSMEAYESEESPDIISFTIPKHAVSVLINGDSSGLEDDDEEEINNFVDKIVSKFGNANFMLPSEDEMDLGFCYRNDINNLGGECYKLLIKPSNKEVNENIKGKQKQKKSALNMKKLNAFVENVVDKKYHSLATKGDIVSLIKERMNEPVTNISEKTKGRLPEFMSFDSIVSAAEPQTKPDPKSPETIPSRPAEPRITPDQDPRRRPFRNPNEEPAVQPKPKAKTRILNKKMSMPIAAE